MEGIMFICGGVCILDWFLCWIRGFIVVKWLTWCDVLQVVAVSRLRHLLNSLGLLLASVSVCLLLLASCGCWKLGVLSVVSAIGGPVSSCFSARCSGMNTVAVTAAFLTKGLTCSCSDGYHFWWEASSENGPVKGVAFEPMTLKRRKQLIGMDLKRW